MRILRERIERENWMTNEIGEEQTICIQFMETEEQGDSQCLGTKGSCVQRLTKTSPSTGIGIVTEPLYSLGCQVSIRSEYLVLCSVATESIEQEMLCFSEAGLADVGPVDQSQCRSPDGFKFSLTALTSTRLISKNHLRFKYSRLICVSSRRVSSLLH